MSPVVPFRTRGACPGVFDPMESGDGWLVRIRLPGGRITPAAMRATAGVASAHGSGAIDLTSRGNLQLRGMLVESLQAAGAGLVAAGLAGTDSRLDGLRSIVASPLTGHDPTAIVDATPVVDAIERALAARLDGSLPSKFLVAVDDGGAWSLGHLGADVALRSLPGVGEWMVSVRGTAEPIGVADDPADVAVQVGRLCAEAGARMDAVAAEVPLDALRELLHVRPPAGPPPQTPPAGALRDLLELRPPAGPSIPAPPARGTVALGVHPGGTAATCNVLAAPFLGRLDAATMDALAAIVERACAEVRVTTARSLAICGVARSDVAALIDDLRSSGMIVTDDDPRALLSACVGSRGCRSSYADTTAAAERLAASATTSAITAFHLSGCGKCCGAPAGPATLVADEAGVFRPRAYAG
jgi:precorrin-3B synthase